MVWWTTVGPYGSPSSGPGATVSTCSGNSGLTENLPATASGGNASTARTPGPAAVSRTRSPAPRTTAPTTRWRNHAPAALKKADCGIAVSGATDAARAAASMVLLTPGLSVVIDAMKESRRIFQRMNSYAIYRIAETLRVLLFMTLAILVFNFYPVTAVMIVMLALLNDGAILSIAYDNVHYKDRPEAWNMRMVLGIAMVLGVIGVVSAFGLFYLGERFFNSTPRPYGQTLMYLKLSVAGGPK